MNKAFLFAFLILPIGLLACRAPHARPYVEPPASVGTATSTNAQGASSPAPSTAAASQPPTSGQPLPDGQMMPIAEVLSKNQSELSGVSFYFGDQSHSKVEKEIGTYVSNKKTNAYNKTDEEACEWVALAVLREFHKRALGEGGNAVINIHSYYKKNDVSDPNRYECHAGALMAGVAFRGTVVKLAK